jgi:hypothetical protein
MEQQSLHFAFMSVKDPVEWDQDPGDLFSLDIPAERFSFGI